MVKNLTICLLFISGHSNATPITSHFLPTNEHLTGINLSEPKIFIVFKMKIALHRAENF